jgi:long-chain acyl-CoA synthetase
VEEKRGADSTARPWLRSYDEGVPGTLDYPRETLHDCLGETANRYPGRAAIVFMGEKTSYRQLDDLAERFAAYLQHMGVARGERVVLFLPNSLQFAVAYYGTLRAGAVVVPANPLYSEKELLHVLEDSGAGTIITLDLKSLYGKADAMRQAAGVRKVIACSLPDCLPFPRNILFRLAKRNEIARTEAGNLFRMRGPGPSGTTARSAPPEVKPDDVAVVLYTGGTTGVPKGVCLTHANLVANVVQCSHWLREMRPGAEVFLTVAPVFHAFAMTTSLNLPLYTGATNVLVPRFEVASLVADISRYRPTVLVGVPALFGSMTRHPDLRHHDLASLRFCLSGADALPADVQLDFERLTGRKIVEGYGMTEASPVVTCNPFHGKKKGIGLPLPDTLCEVIDPDTGDPVRPGEIGEMIVRGPQVMHAYCGNEGETAIVLRDGWLHTGDLVRMDDDGYFEMVGRKKDLIKVSKTGYLTAYKVYPSDVEAALLRHDAVEDAAVVGVPDAVEGERVVAFVVRRPGTDVDPEDLIAFCRRDLAEYKVPSQIEFVDAIPKSAIGKALRKELRQRIEQSSR